MKRIHSLHPAEELRVLALTGMIGSDTADTPLERARERWLALEDDRPPAFPERREKPETRYAKALDRYLAKEPEGPGAVRAREWLARFREDT